MKKQILKNVKKANNEVKNIWNFTSFIVDIAAPVLLILIALGHTGISKVAIAAIAAVMVVNTVGKIYSLVRQ